MKITLKIDSSATAELDFPDLQILFGLIDDKPQYAEIFSILARHPSSEIRGQMAQKTALPVASLKILARDPSIEVVQAVARNERALRRFRMPLLREMIERDVSVAAEIASCINQVNEEIRLEILQILIIHDDPAVSDPAASAFSMLIGKE